MQMDLDLESRDFLLSQIVEKSRIKIYVYCFSMKKDNTKSVSEYFSLKKGFGFIGLYWKSISA